MGHSGGLHIEGNELPSLVHVSGEKRPGFTHYKEAGAMKELIPVSAHEQLDSTCMSLSSHLYLDILLLLVNTRLYKTFCFSVCYS